MTEEDAYKEFLKIRAKTRKTMEEWRAKNKPQLIQEERKVNEDIVNADTLGGMTAEQILQKARRFSGGGGRPVYPSDPNTAGLQPGQDWFNITTKEAKLWDGTSKRVYVPSGGAGGTYKLTPSYTIYKVGSDYYAMDEDGNIDFSGADGGAVFQNVLDALYTEGGGVVKLKCVINITTDINLLNFDNDVIIEGIGRHGGDWNNFETGLKSGFILNNAVFTNSLSSNARANIYFKHLAIGWKNITSSKPCFNLDYLTTHWHNCELYEASNTFTSGYIHGILTQSDTSPPTPSSKMILDNCALRTDSNNCVCIYAQYEPLILRDVIFLFTGTNQTGIMVAGVTVQRASGIHFWFGSASNNDYGIRFFNAAKKLYVDVLNVASHANSGTTTSNKIVGIRAGQSWISGRKNLVIGNAGTDEGATGLYWIPKPSSPYKQQMWENDSAKVATRILGTFANLLTQNRGSSTGTGAQQTIPHYLAATPSVVLLSPPASNAIESASADETNIYVTADIGEKWYWIADCLP